MDTYLDLRRRFSLLAKYTPEELFASQVSDKRLDWDKVLEGRFSLIVGRANFGKTMELRAKSKALRAQGRSAIYLALHKILGAHSFEDALDADDAASFVRWIDCGGELIAFVDSLDEAALGTDDGIRKALRGLGKALGWPTADVRWVLSCRPAVLTDEVRALLQTELRTTLYAEGSKSSSSEAGFEVAEAADAFEDRRDLTIGDVAYTHATSRIETRVSSNTLLKVYTLLPLDSAGAKVYLRQHHGISLPDQMLTAAWQYGLGRLAEGPGGLDILAYINSAETPPHHLTEIFDRVVQAVQAQQRMDPREGSVGNPPPESLSEAIERLAAASTVCQLLNIEVSPKALRYRDGVLSARPLIASLLSEQSLTYLLGSRLFVDSGQYQVKLYPDELLPFLAAKHLASLVRSPEHARRLLSNFAWHATTGECGVSRVLLPFVGWLSVFSAHCRQELLDLEPQAVALFGDLRNPNVQLAEASLAVTRTIERLVSEGDSLGRGYYYLTAENYWQAAKPGIEPTLKSLFDRYGADLHARTELLAIAGYGKMDILRDAVLNDYGWDYRKLLSKQRDLDYIVSLDQDNDLRALGAALQAEHDLSETPLARLVGKLAWRVLSAKSISEIVVQQFSMERDGFWINWAVTHEVAESASGDELYKLSQSLLLRLAGFKSSSANRVRGKFAELVIDVLTLAIERAVVAPSQAAKLCLIFDRLVKRAEYMDADTSKLRTALQEHKEIRLKFLRGLIHSTDKTANGISEAVYSSSIYPLVVGDEVEIQEPGFAEVVANQMKSSVIKSGKPAKKRERSLSISQQAKTELHALLTSTCDASNERALAWVAQWVNQTTQRNRYGECNFSLFEHAAGDEIANVVRLGLASLWRTKGPTWKESEPHSTYNITIAGLQGLHLELGDGSRLPSFSEREVRQAIRYAQFEMNSYPKWFWNVVREHDRVATEELALILASANKGQVSRAKAESLVRHLNEAPRSVQVSLTRAVWESILAKPKSAGYIIESALALVAANPGIIDQATFEAEAECRIAVVLGDGGCTADDLREVVEGGQSSQQAFGSRVQAIKSLHFEPLIWASSWFWNFPDGFCRRCEFWLATMPSTARDFMSALAAYLGEDRSSRLMEMSERGDAALNSLKFFYEWVCSVVREEDDTVHEEGKVYSMDDRDYAERLRGVLITAIAHAKSERAYEILDELRRRAVGNRAKFLRHTQFMMREEQHNRRPIAQTEYLEFERNFSPRVSDYTTFAMAVESDLLVVKSQIEFGDFSLRRFFNSLNFNRIKTENDGLALEEDFQALLGSELNHIAGRRYAVTLESVLPEGTRRDVLCQAGSLRATVELKMSSRWTLPDYVEALEKQLQGQYMKAPNSKIGFFVIVLQKERTWYDRDGNRLEFQELLAVLRAKAREKEILDSSVFLRVIGIDATPKEDFRSTNRVIKIRTDGLRGKYADGAGNVWSGRGKRPEWIRAALSSGMSLDDFLTAKREHSEK